VNLVCWTWKAQAKRSLHGLQIKLATSRAKWSQWLLCNNTVSDCYIYLLVDIYYGTILIVFWNAPNRQLITALYNKLLPFKYLKFRQIKHHLNKSSPENFTHMRTLREQIPWVNYNFQGLVRIKFLILLQGCCFVARQLNNIHSLSQSVLYKFVFSC